MHAHNQTMLSKLGFADPDKRLPLHDLACQYLGEAGNANLLIDKIVAPVIRASDRRDRTWSQDGFDFVGIFCINRQNLLGAETHLHEHPDQPPIFAKELHPGEFVLVNDRRLYHYTTGMKAVGTVEGSRDVFVMTA